jgi:tetratricopeptide (TPR) repeat protein
MTSTAELLGLALQYHQAGDLPRAEELYRQILQADPANADAHHLLGAVAHQVGQHEQAVASMRQAVALNPQAAAYHSNLGLALLAVGRLDEAQASLEEAVRLQPDLPEAQMNLGNILLRVKKLDQAVHYYHGALRLRPNYPEAHCNLGNALRDQGHLDLAAAHFRQALQLAPQFAAAHSNLASVLVAQGRYDEAVASCQQALRIDPNFAGAHINMGTAFKAMGRLHDVVACCKEALRIDPNLAVAHNNLGQALLELGQCPDAEAWFRAALRISPDLAEAHNNLGNALKDQGKFEEAMACYDRALELQSNYAEAHNNMGIVLDNQGRLADAVVAYKKALQLRPEFGAAYSNLGNALKEQGKFDEAAQCFEKALQRDPNSAEMHFNRAILWLLHGDFERGWPEYEWRWRTSFYPRYGFTQPRWDGAELAGKTIFVYSEQGLGDTIQFVRYLHLVKERGGKVIFRCQPPLLRLLKCIKEIDQLVPEGAQLPAFDVQSPLLSLPGIFGTAQGSVPAPVPYLNAEDELVGQWRDAMPRKTRKGKPARRMGIAWQGNPAHVSDRKRSIALKHFAPLAQIDGVELVSLQKGPGADQLAALSASLSIVDVEARLGDDSESLSQIAALMKNLDLVISCDSAIAHLAGALGVQVWVALPRIPDWRWLLQGEESPWYPTMKLFRQQKSWQWEDVFERMASCLREMTTQ